MEWFNSLLPEHWGTLIVTFGGLAGLLGWAVGLPSVLKILSAIIDVVSPIAKLVTGAVAGASRWVWYTVCWPALKDIFDNWRTAIFAIATVVSMGLYMDYRMDKAVNKLTDNLSTCQSEVVKLKKREHRRPSNDFLWPFW